jgi:hypothetical protein
MKRPGHLTDAEARTLTRGEILERVAAELGYWHANPPKTGAARAAYRECAAIMHAYIDPGKAMQAALDALEGRGRLGYWEQRPRDEAPEPPPEI